ncbi:MAG: HEAT repeat domain-containing protein [Bacteroidetes bacterium]|nr:HEAT repeat domain-containing protein [Bacteroidota bacterium]
MKRIVLILFFLAIIIPLSAQMDDYDYNPYEYAEEELFLTSFEIRDRYESDDCAAAIETINNFRNAAARGDEKEKYKYLRAISFYRCKESFDFLETQIKRSSSETDRCNAIMFLAWMLEPDYLPCILEYAGKPALSIQEKAAIATAFMIFGVHDDMPALKEQAIAILEEVCYDAPTDVLASCIVNYMNIGGDAAIDFFTAQLEQEEFRLYAALFLAELGEYEQTFPIFAAALNSDDEYEVHTAVMGLAEIGTEEAIQLIINLPEEKNRLTIREQLINFNPKDIKKGD